MSWSIYIVTSKKMPESEPVCHQDENVTKIFCFTFPGVQRCFLRHWPVACLIFQEVPGWSCSFLGIWTPIFEICHVLENLDPPSTWTCQWVFFQICLAPLAQKIIKVRLVENGCNENDKNHHVTMLRHVTATKWCEMARNVATSMGVIIYSGFSHSYSMVI